MLVVDRHICMIGRMLHESRPQRDPRGGVHMPPSWVESAATYFITINCKKRGLPQLTEGDVPRSLFEAVSHYHQELKWWPEIVLLMPDHLHALVAFSWKDGRGMNGTIQDWKRYTSRTFGIEWQRDWHDHRIRNQGDHADKWSYIANNPVRAGLVADHAEWPHVWFPDRQGRQGPF